MEAQFPVVVMLEFPLYGGHSRNSRGSNCSSIWFRLCIRRYFYSWISQIHHDFHECSGTCHVISRFTSFKRFWKTTLNRFQREDPTFRVGLDPESGQTIISGMGELHLEVYVERIKREYKVDATVGKPRVNFRETITQHAEFDYLYKKQSGGQGQYGRVVGYMEPLPAESETKFEFENMIIGQPIPCNFIPHIEKGFREAANSNIGFT
ncbi:hypothetical protein L2E82_44077 [Cichorium intybus]|uniref:Uncharacterized protein n=1 Tax=Cichorium intybus TaxID=13427 RepID=A0ACB8ZPW6_CICIN|nr:hypothetical protein L2E82_44077 [Cichorium intybus]